MKKMIKRIYKIYFKGDEESIGISVILLMTLLMLLFMLLTSCEANDVMHQNCKPGCNGKIITNDSTTHNYKDPHIR